MVRQRHLKRGKGVQNRPHALGQAKGRHCPHLEAHTYQDGAQTDTQNIPNAKIQLHLCAKGSLHENA